MPNATWSRWASTNGRATPRPKNCELLETIHSVAEQIEFVTRVMTLHSGDVVVRGSSTQGQSPVSDGDHVEVEIDGIGRLAVNVAAAVASPV